MEDKVKGVNELNFDDFAPLSIGKTDSLSYEWLSKAYNMLAVGCSFKGLVKIRG
ncbi:hypothetical protein [uncultured Aquimarina sp.]|uniref:hypothetical protein n=1 Tax=uncultured Aquimarina sp. TaxID=575652 RepID=UPI00261BA189|nr:hypothetical protein [uncultured Aquimarina sp.]